MANTQIVDLQGRRQTRSRQINLARAYFFILGLFTAYYCYRETHTPGAWGIEDWLTNYQAGFVRRGIIGAIVYQVHARLGIGLIQPIFVLQILCYGLILYSAYSLVCRQSEWGLWTWALVLSPAAFSFQVVDRFGGFRKEILFFAGICVLLIFLRAETSDWKIVAFVSLWLPFTILAHEMLFAYAIYYGTALALSGRGYLRVLKMMLLPLTLSAIAMLAVWTHHGNPKMAAQICSSLQEVDPAPCGGALSALGQTGSESQSYLYSYLHTRLLLIWGVTGLLAVTPILVFVRLAFRTAGASSQAGILSVSAATSFLLSLPAYIYAIDWGRWIYIQVLTLSLLILFLDWKDSDLKLPYGDIPANKRTTPRFLACSCLILYATCWTLPHYLPLPLPLGGVMERVVERLLR